MGEGDECGQCVAKGDVAYRQGVVAATAYAALGLVVVKAVAALLMKEQGGVLTDGDVERYVFVVIPLGVEEQRQATLRCSA